MGKRSLLWIILASLAVGFGSCGGLPCGCGYCGKTHRDWRVTEVHGSGDVVRQGLEVGHFTDVHLATIGTAYIELGDRPAMEIEAEENILEYLEAEVQGRTLKISARPNTHLRTTKPVNYYVTVKDLGGVGLSSSGDIVAPDIKSDHFSIDISSSGNLQMGKVRTTDLDVRISSSGDADLKELEADRLDIMLSSSGGLTIGGGQVETQDVSLSSSGTYDGSDLRSTKARVRLSSSGDAYLWVTDDLDAVLSSSGSVYYQGEASVRSRTSSSGRVRQRGI